MLNFPLPRIDLDPQLRKMLIPFCRLKEGDIWEDKIRGHKVGCLDATNSDEIELLMGTQKASLAVHDPPYNFVAFDEKTCAEFIEWCFLWVVNSYNALKDDAALYIWLGADQKNHYQPFPEFILMMKETPFTSRSFITMRNQRGYGTQKNWMSIRQELLYYVKGTPNFNVNAEYTDIPKILKGYYKEINGKVTDNTERSKSPNIRAGNVWVDIQQVFYRMDENVNGCFAQKPLKSSERIILASSNENDIVLDFFSHSGSTLISSEMYNRKCFTTEIDPVFCEITIRRLENLRNTGKPGWQNSNPFAAEIKKSRKIKDYLSLNYGIEFKSIPETV